MNTPRPGRRVHGVIVVGIVVAHAAWVALAWAPASVPKPAVPQRLSMRWLASTPKVQAVVVPIVATAAKPADKVAPTVRAPKPRAAVPAEPRVAVAPEPRVAPVEVVAVAAPVPIQGVAFAPATIGFGPPAVRRVAAFAPAPPPPPTQLLQMQMQSQQHAARAQIAEALQRELGAWQPPLTSQGACALAGEPDAHLACDNDTLTSTVAPREPALAGLLRAWRSMEPRTQGLTIAVVDGRYQATWN